MNKVILIGNLTKDPESKVTSSGTPVTNFSLAVNRRFKNAQGQKETDFITVVTWRQVAELCARYLSKGRKVCVVGQLQSRSYEAQDGSKRYVTEVVADEVEFLSSKGEGADSAGKAGGFTEVDDDNLPF